MSWTEDWSNKISPDEHRIIDWCKKRDFTNKVFLHVGFGSSTLALTIPTKKIDGITIISQEIEKAKSLNIKNYNVFKYDKYSYLIQNLPNKYDIIIDNNMFTFTDCNICIFNYFHWLVELLNDDGEIITDTGGMIWWKDWTIEKYQQLINEFKLPLKIIEYKESHPYYVVGLKKCVI